MFSGSSLLMRLIDIRWPLADFDLLLRDARLGKRRPVGIEAIDARVLQRPFVGGELGAVGEDDLARFVVIVVLNQRTWSSAREFGSYAVAIVTCRPPPGSGAETVKSRLKALT